MRQIRYWGHINRRNKDHILRVAKNQCASEWKVGRPCQTWNTTINQTVEVSGITMGRWEENSRDKHQRKKESRRILEVEEESATGTSSQGEEEKGTESNAGRGQQ
uniref:Uncharacterized protein n=1 Tax=Photinus pyralis TaxID=7054 RepID=A0A1Y1MDY7_PHOPY